MGLRATLGKAVGHTVDIHPSEHHVRVLVGGEVVAESRRPLVVRETGHPDRFYLPCEDVRAEALEPSEKQTRCPFKGEASYVSVKAGGTEVPDAAWTYPAPITDVAPIAGHLSFYPSEQVTVEVDGRPLS